MTITNNGCDLKVGNMFQKGNGKWYKVIEIKNSMLKGYFDYICEPVKILNDIEKSKDEDYLNTMLKSELGYIRSITNRRMENLGFIIRGDENV